MDGLKRYLDPHAAALGLATTALSWIAGLPVTVGVAVGSVTFGIAAAGRAVQRRRDDTADGPPEAGAENAVDLGTSEERWVRRGADAVSAIEGSMRPLAPGPLRDRLTEVAEQAREVLDDVRTLASQASATRATARRLDASRLTSDLTRLTGKLHQSEEPDVEEDLRRSLEAVREQLGIHRRLEGTWKALQARVESGSLGLQRLAAQVGEMTAMASPDGFGLQGRRVEELSTQLEALRSGLSDAGALSRKALGETQTGGGQS